IFFTATLFLSRDAACCVSGGWNCCCPPGRRGQPRLYKRVLTGPPPRQLQPSYFVEVWLPRAHRFVTMNPYSGGKQCLAEMCRVSPAAADDRKVSATRKARFQRRPPIVFLQATLSRSARKLHRQRLALRKIFRQEKQPRTDTILWRQSGYVRSSPGLTGFIPDKLVLSLTAA